MNNITKILKNKLIEITLKKNRLLGRLGLLPAKAENFGTIKDIFKTLTSSNINLQLYKEDKENKDYIFSIIKTLEKNGIQVTLTEFDKIFSTEDIEKINEISKTAKINFRYVYPNFWGGTNISTEMDINSYLETLKKIKHLINVTTSNFTKKEEQIMFIANQISEYVNYDFESEKKSEEEYLKLSSLQGCLEGKKTVCAGIAFAFERCMTEMGIDNMLVLGYSGKKEEPSSIDNNHVWNKVKIYNKWYNVDVTNILAIPNSKITKESRVKIFILSSDKNLSNIGNIITDYSGIPESKENFPETLEIYSKVNNVKNILKEYDNGNISTFLKYNTENNHINHKNEQSHEKIVESEKELQNTL